MFSCIIVIAIVLKEAELKLDPLSEEPGKLRTSLTQCVMAAAKEFHYTDIITMSIATRDFSIYANSTTATDRILLQALYQQMNWTMLVSKSSSVDIASQFFKKSDNYIIQIRDGDEFLATLTFLMDRPSWNPHAKFIVVTSTIFEEPNAVVASIVEALWKSRVLNAIVMVPQKIVSSKITIYSWFPFGSNNCGDGFDETDVINVCKYGQFLNESLLFPEKIPNDMYGCKVKIRAVVWPPYIMNPKKPIADRNNVNFTRGIEILLMNTVAQVANFTIIYSVSDKFQDWGYIYRNNTGSGMMDAVKKEAVDIGLGALASLIYRHHHFDTSVTYLQESITWCVPHAMPQPRWKCLLIIFNFSTWMSVIVSYLCINLGVKALVVRNPNESGSYTSTLNSLQNTYCMMFGLTVKTLPRSSKARFLIWLWAAICLTLTAAYQSSLIGFITKPNFEPQIDSVQELFHMGYSFGLVPPTFKFIRNPDKDSNIFNLTTWTVCDDVKKCLDRTAYNRDFAVGVPRMYMVYASNTYVNKRGENLLYWSKDDIVSFPIEMIMVKGYPLLNRINRLIYRIKEAGLLAKWKDDFLKHPDKNEEKIEHESDNDVILTARHLEGCFIILGIGLGLSSVLFILEILYSKQTRRIAVSKSKN